MGRNRNGRKKAQELGEDIDEQPASSLLIDFHRPTVTAEDHTGFNSGVDALGDVDGHAHTYEEQDEYGSETDDLQGGREYEPPSAYGGLSKQFQATAPIRSSSIHSRFYSEPAFDSELDDERVGDVDIHTADAGARHVGEERQQRQPIEAAASSGKGATTSDTSAGHIRAPIITRHPSRLENISKAVNSYVPSSLAIAIPTAALSPPRVSRPLSFGKFMSPTSEQSHAPVYTNRPSSDSHRRSWGSDAGQKTLDEVLSLDNPAVDFEGSSATMRYPSKDLEGSEHIYWARWDALVDGTKTRRLLLVGYLSGMQIWDCTSLNAPKELLNLPNTAWGRIWHAAVLPEPTSSSDDRLQRARPLIGVVSKRRSHDPQLLIYSLHSHEIVKNITVPGLVSFISNNNFIILSTSNPPTIRILSACTFSVLHVISAASLVPFFRPSLTDNNPNDTTVLVPDIDPDAPPAEHEPLPVFALSHRLLAFASSPPRSDLQPVSTAAASFAQADLGATALRVSTNIGTSMLSGMRSLGGLAINAARARISGPTSPTTTTAAPPSRPFQSRSAPSDRASVDISDETAPLRGDLRSSSSAPAPVVGSAHVTVIDLQPLLNTEHGKPEVVAEWEPAPRAHVAALQFSADGTRVVVVPEDGQTLPVFRLRPVSRAMRRVSAEADPASSVDRRPQHLYDLRRGRTLGNIEFVEPAPDGRWVAIGSRKRTVHVFATNPYGGPPDERSHTGGRVFNLAKLPPSSTTPLAPIKRIYSRKPPTSGPVTAALPPLAFTFISNSIASLPKNLLPPPAVHSPPSSSAGSVTSSPSPEPLSPIARSRPTNYQDILCFDPAHGTLTLHRLYIEPRVSSEQAFVVPGTSYSLPLTSISLPSRPSFGSPSKQPASALSKMIERSSELVAHEGEVAVWPLRRGANWEALRKPITVGARPSKSTALLSRPNWLSNAELQTSSSSRHVLPRTLYLSHQFSFFALSDDYHGLLRRYRFDIPGKAVSVRRAVSVSAHPTGAGDAAFLTHERSGAPASFDDSLSSAITSSLEYPASPPVLPMYPNGAPGTSGSFKNSIPIHRVTDGMSEGIGRLRSQIGRVRSPRMSAMRGEHSNAPVPLEFDEEDEDFLLERGGLHGERRIEDDALSRTTSQDDGPSVSTPSSGADVTALADARGRPDPVAEPWAVWEHADDEAEPFDEISAVGFMDEEQAAHKAELERNKTARVGKKKKRRALE